MKHSIFKKLVFSFFILLTSLLANDQPSIDSFIIIVKTDNPGASSNTEFTIPTSPSSTYDYDIDCGDSTATNGSGEDGDYTCSYNEAGTYTITIDGTFPHIFCENNSKDGDKILSVEQWGNQVWDSMENAFIYADNVVINAADTPNLSNVTSLKFMFHSALNIGNGSGNWNWDISNVQTTHATFVRCASFDKDISDWNTSNLTNMTAMFGDAFSFNQDIGGWDVSRVNTFHYVFKNAKAFNQDIGD